MASNEVLQERCDMNPIDPEPASQATPAVSSRDIQVDGGTGSLPARVHSPKTAGPLPVVLYFHGVPGAAGQDIDAGARGIADEAGAVVVSINPLETPEHALPLKADAALAAYRWLLAQAGSIGGTNDCIALAGEGVGGNLALATAVAAREGGLPPPVHVLVICPMAVLADTDLARLPGVSIVDAEVDPHAAVLEEALRRAGGDVERRAYSGVAHDFFGSAAGLAQAREAQDWAGRRLDTAFATTRPTGG